VSDPIEKRKDFGKTMPAFKHLMQKDPLAHVDTIGFPLYQKESKKEFQQYCKNLEESILAYKIKFNEL